MTARISPELRGFCFRRASYLLRMTLSLSGLLCASIASHADTDLDQSGQITINPSSRAPELTLQGPAFDSATANFGLVLSYHDGTSTNATATSVLRILRPSGEYQWQLSTSAGDGRLAMVLGDNHTLTLLDPTNSSNTIVLHPGTDSNSGVYWNNQRLATVSELASAYVPLVNGGLSVSAGGNVGIGNLTPQYALDVTGTSSNPLASFSSSSGNVAQIRFGSGATAAKFMGTNAQNSFFVNAADGQTNLVTLQDNGNVGIGTTSPGAKLDVEGTLQVGSPNPALWVDPAKGAVAINCAFTDYSSWCKLYVNGGIIATGAIRTWSPQFGGVESDTAWYSGSFLIKDNVGNVRMYIGKQVWTAYDITFEFEDLRFVGANQLEILRLNHTNGNVGINTDAPMAKLDVNGDTHVRGVLRVPAAGDIDMGGFKSGTNPVPQP